jgi:hypothetical protein
VSRFAQRRVYAAGGAAPSPPAARPPGPLAASGAGECLPHDGEVAACGPACRGRGIRRL